jgi:hypothetical protein
MPAYPFQWTNAVIGEQEAANAPRHFLAFLQFFIPE